MRIPLFKRVLLSVEKIEEKPVDPFAIEEEVVKPKITIISVAQDCDPSIQDKEGAEALFNGVVNELIEETDTHKIVLTHETNLLMLK